MQKWEYKLTGYVPGSTDDVITALNELGAEGWELVTSAAEWTFIFKRPLPPPQP